MDGLIFTPRQADFLRDGSIFAQSPAKTSDAAVKAHLPTAESNRSLLGGATASKSPAPILHCPRPRLPTFNSHAKLTQAPETAGSPQLPSFGQDDMAKQIRAKFENLVRASPLPKVVEHLVSPHGIQQIDWSARFSRDASKPPSWHAWQTPASFQSPSGTSWPDKPVIGHPGHHTTSTRVATVEAEAHPRLASETRLCSTAADQSASAAAGQIDSQLLLTQSGMSGDAVLAVPEQQQVTRPTPAGPCAAPEALKVHYHSEAPAAQESMQQHPMASGPAKARQPGSDAACAPACNSVNVGPAPELPQQHQQEAQQGTPCPDGTVLVAVAASHDAQQQQPESMVGAALRQDSSSMVSLSPSLKLDIPGLDDILSSDLLTEDDGHATSQLQPQLQQAPLHDPHHGRDSHDQLQQQQQSVDQQQFADQQQQSVDQQQFADQHQQHQHQQLVDQQEAHTVGQQESAQRGAYPAGPKPVEGTPDDHDALQPSCHAPAHSEPSSLDASAKSPARASGSSDQGMPRQQAGAETTSRPFCARSDTTALADSVADNAVAAWQHPLAAGSQGPSAAVLQSPAGHAALHACQGESATEQAEQLLNLAKPLASRPAQSAAAGTTDDADEPAQSAVAVCQHRHSMASHPTLKAPMPASTSSSPSSQHVPLTNHDSMRLQADAHELGQLPTTDAVVTDQVLAATDAPPESAAHCPQSAAEQTITDELPSKFQRTSMTGSQQGPQHKRRQPSSSSNNSGPSSKRRCVVTRSSQGGQVQPLLTAPSDVSWQDKKGVYETSRRGRVRYPPLAFWMHETKVHDRQGGAIAIQRPAPSPAPPTNPKPPPHAGPAPLARAPHQAQPAASVARSQTQTKQDSQAEAQSQLQSQLMLPEVRMEGSMGASKQVQRSRKHRATSIDAALTKPPPDPPSPPFPYPILAKRAPQASWIAPGLDGVKQAAQKSSSGEQCPPAASAGGNEGSGNATAAAVAGCGKKPSSKGKTRRQVAANACAHEGTSDHRARAHRQRSDESEAGPSAAPAAAVATAVKACADANTALPKMKRCGTCKNCLNAKSAKQGCLVLRAIREQQAQPASATNQEPQAATHPARADKFTAAGAVASAGAEPIKAAEAKARGTTAFQKKDKASKCAKGAKAKAGRGAASRQAAGPDRNSKTLGVSRVSKASEAYLHPDGSIHCALTQAVELASDMEQPDTAEAAEALESLKNSPVASGAPQPAALGLSASAPEQVAAAASLEDSPGKTAGEGLPAKRGRGRPRKERKPGEEAVPASVGPKRGRGRPQKSPLKPVPPDAVQASGSGGSLPAVCGAQPETSAAPPIPCKVKLEKEQQELRPRNAKAKAASGAAPQLDGEGSAEQPSTSGRASSAVAGWTAGQRAALQKAFLTVQPSQRNFWQHVAKQVPGKTALECCNCKFDELPTPVEKVKQTSRLMLSRDSSPIQPPALKLAGGRVKKPSIAARKQWGRQVRWQQRAQEQSEDESPQALQHPTGRSQQQSNLGNPERGSTTSTLLAAIHKQDKADKYIDRILRKQGGRLRKVKAAPMSTAAGHPGRAKQQQSQQATTGVMAELQALGREEPVDEDMYESEQDHYFSEDDA